MKNMKTEPSEKTIIYRTPGDPIEITDSGIGKKRIYQKRKSVSWQWRKKQQSLFHKMNFENGKKIPLKKRWKNAKGEVCLLRELWYGSMWAENVNCSL